jgi:biotin carboxyl carrier protein
VSDTPEVDIIARLMALSARYGLEELEVDEAGLRVTLRAPQPDELGANGGRSYLWQPPTWPASPLEPSPPPHLERAHALLAPLTGTFYRAAAPDALPLVEAGDPVEEGQPVGLIEAMKVFSEITADVAGTVIEIVAQNGKVVQQGEVLLYIDPA